MDHARFILCRAYGDNDIGLHKDDVRGMTIYYFNLMFGISQMLGASVAHPLPRGGCQRRDMEEYIGIEPASSAWRAEVLTVIRILHKIAGEPSLSPAMMLVLEVVNPEHHLYTL